VPGSWKAGRGPHEKRVSVKALRGAERDRVCSGRLQDSHFVGGGCPSVVHAQVYLAMPSPRYAIILGLTEPPLVNRGFSQCDASRAAKKCA
jgi:hypothetical protein